MWRRWSQEMPATSPFSPQIDLEERSISHLASTSLVLRRDCQHRPPQFSLGNVGELRQCFETACDRRPDVILCVAKMIAVYAFVHSAFATDSFGRHQAFAASVGQYVAVLRRKYQYRPPQLSYLKVLRGAAMLRDRVRSSARCDLLCDDDGSS